MTQPGSHPKLNELIRVIPIAQSQQQGVVIITLVGLEVYRDASILTALVQIAPDTRDIRQRFAQPSQLMISMRDEGGRLYIGRLNAIRTQIGSESWQGRAECLFVPALDLAGNALQIEISKIIWERREPLPSGALQVRTGETSYGPWLFAVST